MTTRSGSLTRTGTELARRSDRRVTDEERDKAGARLRGAYALGALTHDELEERLALAFAARTRADLARVTRDLPRDPARRPNVRRAALRAHATTYATVNGGLVAMWAATGGGFFWPAGSVFGWGIGLALHANAYRRRAARSR